MFKFSNRVYDILKWGVGVALPAIAVLYGALATYFNFPVPEKVSSTIMAFVMFLGALLQVSNSAWMQERAALTGRVYLDENEDGIPDFPWKMSQQLFETLKWVTLTGLPAVGVGYATMGKLWGWPMVDDMPMIVGAVVIFLNTLLQFSSAQYNKAKIAYLNSSQN